MTTQALLKPDELSRELAECTTLIGPELIEVERILRTEFSSTVPFVQRILDRGSKLRGKRLRPILMLIAARSCGSIQKNHLVLAAVIEMIHTATLVHDDILDEAQVRRHAATINAEWGNEAAVLAGDFLLSKAYHLAATLDSTLACRWIGQATNLVCEGEMQQIANRGNLDLKEDEYYAIVRGKTAELTAVACRLGAHEAGAPPHFTEALEQYGRDVGVAFQIADDVLDLLGDEWTTGKTLGTDLDKQKLTLPIIHLLHTVDPHVRRNIKEQLRHPDADFRTNLRDELQAAGSLQFAWKKAMDFVTQARQSLAILPPSRDREVLEHLATSLIKRAF
jgi:octaprenyl-diphosphate synthase